MKRYLTIVGIVLLSIHGRAQVEDSVNTSITNGLTSQKKDPLFNRMWAPIGLSLISVDLMRDSAKYGLQKLVRSTVSDTFRTHLDDWLLWGPIPIMYGADLFKVPAKNTVWNQTKFLIISEIGTSALTWGLKLGLRIERPDNGALDAYPSGHTSQAFCQSQVLFNEFRETAPLLAASGFLFSVPVAALRVLNNRHWVPDVLLGAGVAILVTNLVYHFEPLKDWNPFEKRRKKKALRNEKKLMFIPSFRSDFKGFNLRLSL